MGSSVSQPALISAVGAHPKLWGPCAPPAWRPHLKKSSVDGDMLFDHPGWEDMSHGIQKETSKVHQRWWKSLRDHVRRDLTKEEKSARSGAPAPKKKPHIYHQNLASGRMVFNIAERREEAGEVPAVDRPTTSVMDSSTHTSANDSSVESHAEETTQGIQHQPTTRGGALLWRCPWV
ncbi:uncharacterized protein LOC143996405 [Lithobates pipiens]